MAPPPQSSEESSLNLSILIILLILSITVLVSVSLCLLLRYFRRRQLLHSRSRRVSPEIAAVETDPPAVIDSLPVFTFSSVKRRQSSAASGDCSVCLSRFEPTDQLRLLPLCCHAFHAECIDVWLRTNHTCPLCRSSIHASESDIKALLPPSGSFRLQIGSVSRRQPDPENQNQLQLGRSSYSIGSFDYLVESESEVIASQTHHRNLSYKESAAGAEPIPIPAPALLEDVGAGGRGWLKDYADRLSASFSSRSLSGRFFAGSSRRTESEAEWDLEASRVGEEITEMFRWFSGV